MPGNEIVGKEELNELKKIFTKSNGVLFAHAFDKRRKNIFRIRSFEKELSKLLHNNIPVNETSACFWCTCTFSNHPIFIPQHKQDDIFKCNTFEE